MSAVPAVLQNPRTSAPAQYLRPEAFSPEGAGRARAPWLIAPGPSLGIPRLDHVGLRHSSFGSDAGAARFATTLIELGIGNPSDWSGCGREPAKFLRRTLDRFVERQAEAAIDGAFELSVTLSTDPHEWCETEDEPDGSQMFLYMEAGSCGFVNLGPALALCEKEHPQLPVTSAFAHGLYKLMAYKDEYEVARLHLDTIERAKLSDEFGPRARVRIMLQPPLLKRLGLHRKISLGPVTRPAFRLLHAARRLRGTPFDPFGHTRMRRIERALVGEYLGLVGRAIGQLDPASAAAVAAVVELPDLIRGYEGVKLAGIDRFRSESVVRLRAVSDTHRSAARSA